VDPQIGCIDHNALGFGPFAGEVGEDAVEDPTTASADEAVAQRRVRAIVLRRILLLQAVADHIDDVAHHGAVSNARHTMGQRKEGRDSSHLPLAQQEQITHHSLLIGDCDSQLMAT